MRKIEVFWNDVEEAPSMYNNVQDWCVEDGCLCILDTNCKNTVIPLSDIDIIESVEVKE